MNYYQRNKIFKIPNLEKINDSVLHLLCFIFIRIILECISFVKIFKNNHSYICIHTNRDDLLSEVIVVDTPTPVLS